MSSYHKCEPACTRPTNVPTTSNTLRLPRTRKRSINAPDRARDLRARATRIQQGRRPAGQRSDGRGRASQPGRIVATPDPVRPPARMPAFPPVLLRPERREHIEVLRGAQPRRVDRSRLPRAGGPARSTGPCRGSAPCRPGPSGSGHHTLVRMLTWPRLVR